MSAWLDALAGRGRAHLAMLLACSAVTACADQSQLKNQLQSATNARALPAVAACWETTFETEEFRGALTVTLDFAVAGGSGAISDVSVTALEDNDGNEAKALDPARHPFAECLRRALSGASLAGGGWSRSDDVRVRALRIAFVGPEQQLDTSTPRLVGPRADRCRGLYSHWPPRDAATVHGELDAAEDEAARYRESDEDHYARALQRAYDLALELRQRFERDSADDGLSTESAAHLKDELKRVSHKAEQIGALIGCGK